MPSDQVRWLIGRYVRVVTLAATANDMHVTYTSDVHVCGGSSSCSFGAAVTGRSCAQRQASVPVYRASKAAVRV